LSLVTTTIARKASSECACIEHIERARDIGVEGRDRVFVTGADQRLCREMKQDLGLNRAQPASRAFAVADVAERRGYGGLQCVESIECLGRKRVPMHVGAEFVEPKREP
jgi:hypothetical protein